MMTMIADAHTMAVGIAQNAGYDAYNNGGSYAPALSPIILDLIAEVEVGMGAVEIFSAYLKGWTMAADAECARILAEV